MLVFDNLAEDWEEGSVVCHETGLSELRLRRGAAMSLNITVVGFALQFYISLIKHIGGLI